MIAIIPAPFIVTAPIGGKIYIIIFKRQWYSVRLAEAMTLQ